MRFRYLIVLTILAAQVGVFALLAWRSVVYLDQVLEAIGQAVAARHTVADVPAFPYVVLPAGALLIVAMAWLQMWCLDQQRPPETPMQPRDLPSTEA